VSQVSAAKREPNKTDCFLTNSCHFVRSRRKSWQKKCKWSCKKGDQRFVQSSEAEARTHCLLAHLLLPPPPSSDDQVTRTFGPRSESRIKRSCEGRVKSSVDLNRLGKVKQLVPLIVKQCPVERRENRGSESFSLSLGD